MRLDTDCDGELRVTPGEVTLVEGVQRVEDEEIAIFGAVYNGLETAVFAQVKVELLDADGELLTYKKRRGRGGGELASTLVVVEREIIPPGELSPFKFLRRDEDLQGDYDHHRLSVHTEVVPQHGRGKLTDVARKFGYRSFAVDGRFAQVGEESCERPGVVAALYDRRCKVASVASIVFPTNEAERIAEGTVVRFRLRVPGERDFLVKTLGRCGRSSGLD